MLLAASSPDALSQSLSKPTRPAVTRTPDGHPDLQGTWAGAMNENQPKSEIILYQTEDGVTRVEVRLQDETVWLTVAQMAELFQRDRTSVFKHIQNITSVRL